MDETENIDEVTELEFVRSKSLSQQKKIMEFWKYLDSQDNLKPYKPSSSAEDKKLNLPPISIPSSKIPSNTKLSITKPRIKKGIKEKKKDTNTCKLEKYLKEGAQYADIEKISFEEINAEIEDFEKRLNRCNCKNTECDCEKKTLTDYERK